MDNPKYGTYWAVVAVALAAAILMTCSGGGGGGDGTTPPTIQNEIGPAGGTLTFANGVKLVFPPGAVDTPTVITIEDLPEAQINDILSNPAMVSTRAKRFLGGFSAKPDGLTFKVPVEAWFPVPSFESYKIPIEINVQLNEGTYSYSSSTLEYDGSTHMVKLELQHFSPKTVALLSPDDDSFAGLTPEQFDTFCTFCGSYQSHTVCEDFDPLQPACCLIKENKRTEEDCPSAVGCDCCREKRMKVIAMATDIAGAGCQWLGSDIRITYVDCPSSPTETDSITESTCDVTLEMKIEPQTMDLPVHQTGTFSATVTGTSPTAGIIFQNIEALPIWKSETPSVADFVNLNGTILGSSPSVTPVTIHATLSEASGVEATALVTVHCLSCTLEIQAATTEVKLGESLNLTAVIRDSQDALVSVPPEMITWANTDPDVAALSKTIGKVVTLSTATVGTTVVSATYTDSREQFSAYLSITVLPPYTVVDIGSLGYISYAQDINNGGQIVGYYDYRDENHNSHMHCFLYSGGLMTDIGSLDPTDEHFCEAYGVNDNGWIVGYTRVELDPLSYPYHAFGYINGTMLDLGSLQEEKHLSQANAINANGSIVGYAYINVSGWTFPVRRAGIIYIGGTWIDLGVLDPSLPSAESVAYNINDNGEVVGYSNDHAFLFSDGVMSDLGTLGGTASYAYGINANGQVVGIAYIANDAAQRAFLYSGGTMTDIGTLGGWNSGASDINASGQIVGRSQITGNVDWHAFLYSNGVMTDLNTLIDPASGWTLTDARAINDLGEIIGTGTLEGVTRQYLLH